MGQVVKDKVYADLIRKVVRSTNGPAVLARAAARIAEGMVRAAG
jgi:hypothetical protein